MKQWRGKATWTCYTVIKRPSRFVYEPLTRNVKLAVTRRSRLVLRQPIISISARQLFSRLSSNTVHRVRLWNLAFTRSMYLSPHHSISLKCIHLLPFLLCFSLSRLATGWTVRGSNSGGGEIFRKPALVSTEPLEQGILGLLPAGTAAGEWRWPPTPIQPRN